MIVAWFAKIFGADAVSELVKLIPPLAKSLGDFFANHADKTESKAAFTQARAANKIATDAARAEALRVASRKLSDASSRD